MVPVLTNDGTLHNMFYSLHNVLEGERERQPYLIKFL
jgi:hypothetical protein